ncbi:PREDICTED: uncharacterized protein LOC108548043 [Eufriesea mexicana]|uniref:uncharacterized protein LOC108548043 n=1 Tax=Eufriesea mexicana TaxID=516756 RepID=UPI00083C539D|nr:PREDICTED: uncharacterized protein LOC108548043 [Eufriesea mexicana]
MTDNRCRCPRCLHSSCPLPYARPPYDEVVHEIDDNFVSVRIPKRRKKISASTLIARMPKVPYVSSFPRSSRVGKPRDLRRKFRGGRRRITRVSRTGEKCRSGCSKVHVIPNQYPPTKKPEEEILSLKAIRHIMANDDLRNTLEIEFKAPRNYIPLPEPGPPPPIIVPKQRARKKGKGKGKRKRKR